MNPGNADLPIGNDIITGQEAKGLNHNTTEWRSRGYLPHFENALFIQHVTFHLADSLPVEAVQRLSDELKTIPAERRDVERRKRIEEWIDAGHGSCVLRNPAIAGMVEKSFMYFDGQRYHLLAWVIMPNHVHIIFQPMNPWNVAGIVASWKKFTARNICDHLRKLAC